MAELLEHDVRHLGREHVICCYELGDVIVDPGPESTLGTLLAALDGRQPRAILLTHIHLDHAGAAGTLAARWPAVEVWVHERGAPHLVDPSRLVASARRLYGDDLERLWGEIAPVPEGRLRVLSGGERLNGFRVAYTPGHASHHVAYLHEGSGIAFAGDAAGVRIDGGPALPPTPPPDVDIDAWRGSLDAIAAWAPERVAITHFGAFGDVAEHLSELREGLGRWPAEARGTDAAGFGERLGAHVRERADDRVVQEYLQAMPPEQSWAGLDRYWSRRSG